MLLNLCKTRARYRNCLNIINFINPTGKPNRLCSFGAEFLSLQIGSEIQSARFAAVMLDAFCPNDMIFSLLCRNLTKKQIGNHYYLGQSYINRKVNRAVLVWELLSTNYQLWELLSTFYQLSRWNQFPNPLFFRILRFFDRALHTGLKSARGYRKRRSKRVIQRSKQLQTESQHRSIDQTRQRLGKSRSQKTIENW